MSGSTGRLVAIGVGNVLLCDDGVGIHVIESLRRRAKARRGLLPAGTRLVDGGTLGLGLLDELDGARGLVLVDAVDLGLPAGTVTILDAAPDGTAGPLDLPGIRGLISAARMVGILPAEVSLVGVQVGEIGVDLALSPAVAAALPRAVEAAIGELWRIDAVSDRDTADMADAADAPLAGVTA